MQSINKNQFFVLWPLKPYERPVCEKTKEEKSYKKRKEKKNGNKRRENLGIVDSYIHKIGISRKQNYLVKRE